MRRVAFLGKALLLLCFIYPLLVSAEPFVGSSANYYLADPESFLDKKVLILVTDVVLPGTTIENQMKTMKCYKADTINYDTKNSTFTGSGGAINVLIEQKYAGEFARKAKDIWNPGMDSAKAPLLCDGHNSETAPLSVMGTFKRFRKSGDTRENSGEFYIEVKKYSLLPTKGNKSGVDVDVEGSDR